MSNDNYLSPLATIRLPRSRPSLTGWGWVFQDRGFPRSRPSTRLRLPFLFALLRLFRPVARQVQFHDHAVMD